MLVHRERGADRSKSGCADRIACERTEPARLLFGHDESVPQGNVGARENRVGGFVLRSQGRYHLLAAEYGCWSEVPEDRTGFTSGAGALAGWSGKGPPEAVRIILLVHGATYVLVEGRSE